MMVYEDEIAMYNEYNNDDDKVYEVGNDIEMKMMDDQAMVVDIVLLLVVVGGGDLILNDVKVMVVNALIPTKRISLPLKKTLQK
jgi:hypothetical protein